MLGGSEKTRERILEAARALFGASGTASVSTNHVAAAAGISPGNLYYHFANKEAIIAALVDRTAARLEQAWDDATRGLSEFGPARFETAVERFLGELAESSFVARELFTLAQHLPSIGERERRMRESRVSALESALESFVDPHKLRAAGVRAHQIAELAWLVSFPALAEAQLAGETGARAARRATQAIMALIAPYV
jgi:AcrR family transcriptional regulator